LQAEVSFVGGGDFQFFPACRRTWRFLGSRVLKTESWSTVAVKVGSGEVRVGL
jgi:hypothetical protein